MTDPNLRCQVANAMVDAPTPIPDDTCTSDVATDMANVMLSTVAELASRSKRPRGAQGWCARPGVEADMNEAWQHREKARRHLRAEESFNDWGGWGCNKFVPVLGGDGTKIFPPRECFDQPPGEMS